MSSRLTHQQEGCERSFRSGMCGVGAAFLAAILLGGGTPASAGFIPVATTMTPIPDGNGMFTFPGVFVPSISGGVVAFLGQGNGGQQGVYVGLPGQKGYDLVKVADKNTPIPNKKENFQSFAGEPSVSQDGKVVAFGANMRSGNPTSIYIGVKKDNSYQLSLVADTSTKIPKTSGGFNGNFVAFGSPSISGDQIVFLGFSANPKNPREPTEAGIYTAVPSGNGYAVIPVVDTNTTIPGENKSFTAFGAFPSPSGNQVLFTGGTEGGGRQPGLYLGTLNKQGTGFEVVKVADTSTAAPKGSGGYDGNFMDFQSNPALSNGVAAFLGGNKDLQGVYLGISDPKGGYTIPSPPVADIQTRVPGTMEDFTSFLPASISGGTVVFEGSGGEKSGLFLRTFTQNPFKLGDLQPLVLRGDTDQGITLQGGIYFGHAGFDGKQAAFYNGSFTSASGSGKGIFVTTTPKAAGAPEPTSLILFAIGLAGMAGYGWRRKTIG